MLTAKQAKAIAERYQRAVELVEQGRVYPLYGRDGEYVVLNGAGVAYWVQLAGDETHCDCPDFRYRADKIGCCKHVLAAQLYAERHGAGDRPQPQAVNPDAACQRCGMTVETDQLYCEPCQRLVDQGLAETLCRRHGCERVATRGEYCALHAPREPEPELDDDGFPVAWCQQCGVAIERGELCDPCAEKARELFRALVG